MLTVDYDRLTMRPGDRVLDLGCGAGRHAFESVRRGAVVVALDRDYAELESVRDTFAAMADADEVPPGCFGTPLLGDALSLPFADASFDRIIASEVLEHVDRDDDALRELVRVLRPGGTIAITVPAWLPERICWALSDKYHAPFVAGGHVRIYRRAELEAKMAASGLAVAARTTHTLCTRRTGGCGAP